jgi:hypothetical protein
MVQMFDNPVSAATAFRTLEPQGEFPAGTALNVTARVETRGQRQTGILLCRRIEIDGQRFLILNEELMKVVGDPLPELS